MMFIHIVAINKKNVIGNDLQMIWKNREDLRFFREKTFHKVVILGRITYESIKELKHRTFVVISSKSQKNTDTAYFVKSVEEAIKLSKELSNGEDVFIAGGELIYQQTKSHIDKIYLSQIQNENEGNKHYLVPYGFSVSEVVSYDTFDLYIYQKDKN